MKSFLVAAALSVGVIASAAFASENDGQSGWSFDVSGQQPSSITSVSFVNEDGSEVEVPMAAAQGGPTNFLGSEDDVKKPGDPSQVNGGNEGESLPTVPLPAPVLMAALGVIAVVIGRSQLSRVVGR